MEGDAAILLHMSSPTTAKTSLQELVDSELKADGSGPKTAIKLMDSVDGDSYLASAICYSRTGRKVAPGTFRNWYDRHLASNDAE